MSTSDKNPYAGRRSVPRSDPAELEVERLDHDEAWRLLGTAPFGRLAVVRPDGAPDVFPMNFTLRGAHILLRSAAGSKLHDITVHPQVAFEVDGHDAGARWSVVVHGEATRMETDAEIEASGVLGLWTASPTEKFSYVRVTPGVVTGRRFAVGAGLGA